MIPIPSLIRRPWLLIRGALVDRDRPDLRHLRSIEDPERFIWAILPQVARSFATSIVVLPDSAARAAAVAYLYCRMLDTYEDLHPPGRARQEALASFAARLGAEPIPGPPTLDRPAATDQRDRADLLLVERCGLVDRVFSTLPPDDQANITRLVAQMGKGMVWSAERFEEQGGVLESEDQLLRYCRNVIGEPALFTMRLLTPAPITSVRREDALSVSEMIQLANITRDIEKDLLRGIGYHPALKPYLHQDAAADPAAADQVRAVRRQLLVLALLRVPAYRRLLADLDSPRVSTARASAVLMLLFTDRYYRSCAEEIGHPSWPGQKRTSLLLLQAALAAASPRWAHRIASHVERNFLLAARSIAAAA